MAGGNTFANGINDNGVIVGWYTATPNSNNTGFIYQHGVYTSYNFPGATDTYLVSLRNQHLIVGNYFDIQGVYHSFLLAGSVTLPIAFPGSYQTNANDINNLGEVVGNIFNSSGSVVQGFLLSNGVYSKIIFPGSVTTLARGINDDGVITGSYTDTKGTTHGFMAIPVP